MEIVITYSSIYGASAYYAGLLAEKLGIQAWNLDDFTRTDADVLIHFGGIYAGTINGLRKASSILPDDRLFVLCTTGLADPEKEKTRNEIRITAAKILKGRNCMIFPLRGDMDYSRLTIKHRAMMWALVKMLKAKKNRTDDDEALIGTYGGKLDFKDPEAIIPVANIIIKIMEKKMVDIKISADNPLCSHSG